MRLLHPLKRVEPEFCVSTNLSYTVMSLIIRTKLNNFISGIRILRNTLINNFLQKSGDVRTIRGIVQELDL